MLSNKFTRSAALVAALMTAPMAALAQDATAPNATPQTEALTEENAPVLGYMTFSVKFNESAARISPEMVGEAIMEGTIEGQPLPDMETCLSGPQTFVDTMDEQVSQFELMMSLQSGVNFGGTITAQANVLCLEQETGNSQSASAQTPVVTAPQP